MEAAEKIPKKLYVYLDTTRKDHHRNVREAVRHCRAGDRDWHRRQRGVRAGAVGAFPAVNCLRRAEGGPVFAACRPSPFRSLGTGGRARKQVRMKKLRKKKNSRTKTRKLAKRKKYFLGAHTRYRGRMSYMRRNFKCFDT